MANEYVNSTTLKATLSLTGETFADADVSAACTAASRAIDDYCGRRFYPDSDVNQIRYYTAASSRLVLIDDLITCTSVKTDTAGTYTWTTTLTLNTDYLLEPANAVADGWPYTRLVANPRTGYTFEPYERWVKVTGKFGFATSAPAEIIEACTILASRLLRRSREAPFGIVAVGLEVGAAMRLSRIDPDVAMLLDPYRKIPV